MRLFEVCDMCLTDKPVFNFWQDCCRLRFLLTLPSKPVRRAWIARFAAQYRIDPSLEEQRGKLAYAAAKSLPLAEAVRSAIREAP